MKKIIATTAVAAALLGAAPVATAETGHSGRNGSTGHSAQRSGASNSAGPANLCDAIKRLFNNSPSVGHSGR